MIPHVKKVLCATDFSTYGEAPIPVSFAVVADGGTVVLLHIEEADAVPSPLYAHYTAEKVPTPEQREALYAALSQRMEDLVPQWAKERDVTVEAMVRADASPGHGIVAASEELDVDVICVGTHGKSSLAHLLAGSTTTHVMRHTRRRVLAVRPMLDRTGDADDS